MKYNLPRKYLSYSSWSLWKKDKDTFRRKYYLNEPSPENRETIYGKKIARLLEDREEVKKHPTLSLIPHYEKSEHGINIEIDGLPIRGYLDLFQPDTFSFIEIKTGHLNKYNKPPWDKVSVHRHDQLPFYSLLVESKYGKVDRITYLYWLETKWKEKSVEFDGHLLTGKTTDLELTGNIHQFKRIIPKWERNLIKEDIIRVAKEISQDFTHYEKRN